MSDKFKPGDKVRVIGYERVMHFIGYDKDGYSVCQRGDCEFKAYTRASLELIPEPRKVSGWVNIYSDGVAFYAQRDTADVFKEHRLACIYVSGTEGVEP